MSEQDEQDVATTEATEEQELEINLDDIEDVEAQEKTYTEQQFKQVLARAKSAEAKLKDKPAEVTQNTNSNVLSEQDIEAKILQAQGMDKELLDEAKVLAKLRNKSILEIQKDPIFIAMKAEKEAMVKAQKAKLGASRGSSQARTEKAITSSNLTEEEHRALWREQRDK